MNFKDRIAYHIGTVGRAHINDLQSAFSQTSRATILWAVSELAKERAITREGGGYYTAEPFSPPVALQSEPEQPVVPAADDEPAPTPEPVENEAPQQRPTLQIAVWNDGEVTLQRGEEIMLLSSDERVQMMNFLLRMSP